MHTRTITRVAIFSALVAVATMVLNLPLPHVHGFINVGDSVIFVAGLLFGPVVGGLAGGLGSMLADLLLGYAHWAPWTLVIKGIEGVIVGSLARRPLAAMPAAAVWMVGGYFVAASIMYGVGPAAASVPGDLLQGAGSIAIASLVYFPLRQRLHERD